MKSTIAFTLIMAAALPLTAAWDEDPRCRRRRRRLFDPNEPDPRLVEDGLTIEDIRLHPRSDDNLTAVPRHHEGLLRGHNRLAAVAPRQHEGLPRENNRLLADITTFQLKLYHEEGLVRRRHVF